MIFGHGQKLLDFWCVGAFWPWKEELVLVVLPTTLGYDGGEGNNLWVLIVKERTGVAGAADNGSFQAGMFLGLWVTANDGHSEFWGWGVVGVNSRNIRFGCRHK